MVKQSRFKMLLSKINEYLHAILYKITFCFIFIVFWFGFAFILKQPKNKFVKSKEKVKQPVKKDDDDERNKEIKELEKVVLDLLKNRKTDVQGQKPIHIAAQNKVLHHLIPKIIDQDPNIFRRDTFGRFPQYTALHKNCSLETLEVFLKAGADVHRSAPGEGNALHCAANCDAAVIQKLLKYDGLIYERDDRDSTPLLKALNHGCLFEVFQALLEAGSDPTARNFRNQTALHLIGVCVHPMCDCDLKIATAIINSPNGHSLLNAQDNNGDTPLHMVHNASVKRKFLEEGADPWILNNFGRNPLKELLMMSSVREGVVEVFMKYMKKDILLKDLDNNDQTYLHLAVRNDTCSGYAIRGLIAGGFDPKARTKRGDTPLHVVNKSCKPEVWKELLRGRPELVRKTNDWGDTPLKKNISYPAYIRNTLKWLMLQDKHAGTCLPRDVPKDSLTYYCSCLEDLKLLDAVIGRVKTKPADSGGVEAKSADTGRVEAKSADTGGVETKSASSDGVHKIGSACSSEVKMKPENNTAKVPFSEVFREFYVSGKKASRPWDPALEDFFAGLDSSILEFDDSKLEVYSEEVRELKLAILHSRLYGRRLTTLNRTGREIALNDVVTRALLQVLPDSELEKLTRALLDPDNKWKITMEVPQEVS